MTTEANGTGSRPYRLRDDQANIDMRGRYYAAKESAHHAAMLFCDKWAPIGRSITVYKIGHSASTTYKRVIKGVQII